MSLLQPTHGELLSITVCTNHALALPERIRLKRECLSCRKHTVVIRGKFIGKTVKAMLQSLLLCV